MAREPRRPPPIGVRGWVLLTLLAAALWGAIHLGLEWFGWVPSEGGLQVALRFFARALSPALASEADFVPPDAPPLLLGALQAAGTTLVFAAAAMSLAVVLGFVLGFFASTAWWAGDPVGGGSPWLAALRRTVAPLVYAVARLVIAGMRSVHEILWAVLFVAAFGLNDVAVVLAIAIPYGGTLAKIFSEMVDEAPRDAAHALRGAGGSGVQVFCFGLVSRALPDMTAYAFYRFECALRSSAVLGFFGFETLGLYLRQSYSSGNYGEVWTYLYVLLAMIVAFDWWSGALRRRIVSPVQPAASAASDSGTVEALWRSQGRIGGAFDRHAIAARDQGNAELLLETRQILVVLAIEQRQQRVVVELQETLHARRFALDAGGQGGAHAGTPSAASVHRGAGPSASRRPDRLLGRPATILTSARQPSSASGTATCTA